MLHFVPTIITLSKPEIWAGQAYWLHDFSLCLCKNKFYMLVWSNWNYFTVQLQRKAIFKKLVQTSCFYFYLAWGRQSVGCWPLLLCLVCACVGILWHAEPCYIPWQLWTSFWELSWGKSSFLSAGHCLLCIAFNGPL